LDGIDATWNGLAAVEKKDWKKNAEVKMQVVIQLIM